MEKWKQSDPDKVARLQGRYDLLRELITHFHAKMPPKTPPLALYLSTLSLETHPKSYEEMSEFVDGQLATALSNLPETHPIKQRLKAKYRQLVSGIIPQVILELAKKPSFEEIMTFLAEARHRVAEEVCDLPTAKFGRPRLPGNPKIARTPIVRGGRYDSYLDRILALVPDGLKQDQIQVPEDIDGLTVMNEEIPLSTFLVCREPPKDPKIDWLFGEFVHKERVYPAATIVHTDPEHIPAIKARCSVLYEKLLKNMEIADLAELHWYLAHGMFYTRGSAAIAEWLISGLLGRQVVWDRQPDLEALLQPNLSEFITSNKDTV
ncbi:MAG: hypothetical protein Q8K75_08650 [Chlamydiales bacterium]|nr:hypothetical protein [Chlamydiales bacterium]